MSRTTLFRFFLSVAVVSGSVSTVQAGFFLPKFTGNSQFINPMATGATSDGAVNFAVYQNTDGDWTNDFGAGVLGAITELFDPFVQNNIGNGIDKTATYVYFYSISNTNPNATDEDGLQELEIFLPGGNVSVTSAGYINDYVFDDGAAVGPTGNARMGATADVTAPPDDVPGDGSPSLMGFVFPGAPFTLSAPSVNPNNADEVGLRTIEFEFNTLATVIPPGGYTSVFFLTSNRPATYWSEQLEDGGSTNADIPVPNPEPASLIMTFGALICGLVSVLKGGRRRVTA